MNSLFKLGLIAVLLLTLAAPPAAAQGYEGAFGWVLLGVAVVAVVGFFGVATLTAVGLDYAIPDPPVKLAEEHVEINLAPASVSVAAEYLFQNNAEEEKTLELRYPFGAGRGVGPAENVAATDGAGREIPFTRKKENINFAVAVPAKSRAKVVVVYEQPVSGTIFRYLLGKGRRWGLAGADTTFVVTAPAALANVSSVYSLKKVAADEGGSVRYEYKRKNFYPQNNFTLTWENAPAATP